MNFGSYRKKMNHLFFNTIVFFSYRGTSTVALTIRQRIAAKRVEYNKIKQIENNLQSKREQIRTKNLDIF